MVASGAGHAPGAVPDPGASAGSSRFLCEDATWATPAGTNDHSGLSSLGWSISGHTGTANSLAAFDSGGNAIFILTSAYQAANANLTVLAGLTPTTDNFIISVGSAWASRTPAQARTTLGLGSAALVALDTDTTLAADSDARVPSQHAVKTYVDNAVTGLLDFKGATDASSNPNYPAALKGDAYIISVAGKIGGASGKSVDVGDIYLATADNAGGAEAAVGASWSVLEHNLVGALLAANNLSDVSNVGTARTNLGVGTGDSPEFTAVNVGHPTDTTITRDAAGDIAVEGNRVYRAGGTDVSVADGGTGASTLTAHAVVLGNGTSAVGFATIGTAGRFLVDQGVGTNPIFVTPATALDLSNGEILQNIGGTVTGIPLPFGTPGGRLTGSTLNATYNPLALTPSSTSTDNDTVTFAAAHGWTTGTLVWVGATGGGLTAGTAYWINAISSTEIAFYTTLARAEADNTRENLTTSITAVIFPCGVWSTTLRYTPAIHNRLPCNDGTQWTIKTFSELSLSLSGLLTSGTVYDVFVDDDAVTLSVVGWSTAYVRATDVVRDSSTYLWVKSGDATKLYLGTVFAITTDTIADVWGACGFPARRFIWNAYNRVHQQMFLCPGYTTAQTSYSNATSTPKEWNDDAEARFVIGLAEDSVKYEFTALVNPAGANFWVLGTARDVNNNLFDEVPLSYGTGFYNVSQSSRWNSGIGYHYVALIYYNAGTTPTIYPCVSGPSGSGPVGNGIPYSSWFSGDVVG